MFATTWTNSLDKLLVTLTIYSRIVTFNLCTYNCEGLKTSLGALKKLCSDNDIVMLQETWLYEDELYMLNNIHCEFNGTGTSAMDLQAKIIKGRPHGGVGFLIRKSIFQFCKVKKYEDSRIIGIEYTKEGCSMLLLCVYLPYQCNDNYDEYVNCMNKIVQIVYDYPNANFYVMGDFNSDFTRGDLFGEEFMQICNEHSLCIADKLLLSASSFTCISNAHGTTSWLDHCVTSVTGLDNIESVTVIDEYVCSDHLPVRVVVRCDQGVNHHCISVRDRIDTADWKKAGVHECAQFSVKSGLYLANVEIPVSLINCTDHLCKVHQEDIDRLYGNIVKCLNMATTDSIPHRKTCAHQEIAGWNDLVKESHDVARNDFKFWCINGKPRQGFVYEAMRRSKSQFKYALRQCKRREDNIKADRLAGDLLQHGETEFWKNVRKLNSNKASSSSCIDGVTGEQHIAEYWKSHYEGIFNSVQSTTHKNEVLRRLGTTEFYEDNMVVSKDEVATVVKDLKRGKAIGPDKVAAEALIHSSNRLYYLLGICFTAMLIHGYMPQSLMETKIIPIVKNKCSNLSDKNNHRPVAIANSLSKVFELILLDKCKDYLWTSGNQFGFKPNHSTEMCIYALHEFIDYYRNRCTSVYVTFLDASKAFDK